MSGRLRWRWIYLLPLAVVLLSLAGFRLLGCPDSLRDLRPHFSVPHDVEVGEEFVVRLRLENGAGREVEFGTVRLQGEFLDNVQFLRSVPESTLADNGLTLEFDQVVPGQSELFLELHFRAERPGHVDTVDELIWSWEKRKWYFFQTRRMTRVEGYRGNLIRVSSRRR